MGKVGGGGGRLSLIALCDCGNEEEEWGSGLAHLQEKSHICTCAWICTECAPSSMLGKNWTLGNPLERQLYLGDGVGVVPSTQTQCEQITCSHTMIRHACMVSRWPLASLTLGSTLRHRGSQESKTGWSVFTWSCGQVTVNCLGLTPGLCSSQGS